MFIVIGIYAGAMFASGLALSFVEDERAPYTPVLVAALIFPPVSFPALWLGSRLAR